MIDFLAETILGKEYLLYTSCDWNLEMDLW